MSKPLKIGFDLDGVLVNFTTPWQELLIGRTQKNLFAPDALIGGAGSWNWDKDAGYTSEEIRSALEWVTEHPSWWNTLPPAKGFWEFEFQRKELERLGAQIYFITARAGSPKNYSQIWLDRWAPNSTNTLMMSAEKGLSAKALGLDAYIDDKLENAIDVAVDSPGTRSYLLHYRHNAGIEAGFRRVNSVADMLQKELNP